MSQSRFTQAEWRDMFEQQKTSSLTVRQFCQQTGISTTVPVSSGAGKKSGSWCIFP
ncbi:IS66 family insertion sequence element accessory protein TnpA [Xenorhabdus doucetiae]|uniref:IS66 family insertion sequence element accessory protein TnpA n=1 Tax=Xenorhabdus doucetiae TaxID=351671 RepID=UPI002B40E993|nr:MULTISPECIES: hypothetical protein [unclassified Xenorhabdus]